MNDARAQWSRSWTGFVYIRWLKGKHVWIT